MKNPKKLILICGVLIGVPLGWFGRMMWSQEAPKTLDGEQLEVGTVQAERIEARVRDERIAAYQEKQIRGLEERNAVLSREIAGLQARLDDYTQEETEAAEASKRERDRVVTTRLAEYRALFDLTPEQASAIGEWEWALAQYWREFHAGNRSAKDPVPLVEDKVREILTPEQLEIYEAHLEAKHNNMVEVAAQANLSQYPTTLELSEEQKDGLYRNLYFMYHKSSSGEYVERLNAYRMEGGYKPGAEYLMLAAEGVLSEEQMDQLEDAVTSSK